MKKIAIALMLAVPLSGCLGNQTGVQSASTAAKAGATAANDFYVHASRVGEDLVKQGVLDKARFKQLDQQVYELAVKAGLGQATFSQLVAAAQPLLGGK